jgi:hypothetical protein
MSGGPVVVAGGRGFSGGHHIADLLGSKEGDAYPAQPMVAPLVVGRGAT